MKRFNEIEGGGGSSQLFPIVTHYQPIVCLKTGSTYGQECLSRFIDFDGGGIGPGDIKNFFEKDFLFRMLTKNISDVLTDKVNPLFIYSVNLDPSTICADDRFLPFLSLLSSDPQARKSIRFEMTEENIAFYDFELIHQAIGQINSLGFDFILDDFGAGGADVRCLEKLNFDCVKIDGKLIAGCDKNKMQRERLKQIVKIIRSNHNGSIVAEHIETKESWDIVKDMGIEYGQGFFFGRPTPIPMKPKFE